MLRDLLHTSDINGQCPTTTDCGTGGSLYNNQSLSSFSVGPAPCYVGIASDFLSCVASVVIVGIYIAWKDIRENVSQAIVTFIAISDFLTAIAYMGGSFNLLSFVYSDHTVGPNSECDTFMTFCVIESYIVTCAAMSSYLWTMILAFHLCLIVVFNRPRLANKLLPLYHVIAWGLPVVIAFPLLCIDKLAFAPFVTGVWCYIEIYRNLPPYAKSDIITSILPEVPEVVSFLVMIIFFTVTRIYISRQAKATVTQSGLLPCEQDTARFRISKVERILLFIPITFVLLRMWAVVQYFYSIYLASISEVNGRCIPTSPHKDLHVTLGILQAIGGGGQGWANAILYIFLSTKIRKRLFDCITPNWCIERVRSCKSRSVQENSDSAGSTHFTPSHEPIETDQLIKNWEVL